MRSWLRQKMKPKGGSARPASPRASPPPATAPQPSSSLSRASAASLQERLWSQAYDGLGADESGIVEAYEKFLSAELQRGGSTRTTPTGSEIEPTSEGRWRQMERLVRAGLQRTEKEAAVKQQIGDGIQTVNIVKGLVDKAVQAAPEAALAWVGVCFALEILSNPFTQPGINRNGIAYVVLRMDWYWNLAGLLLDEKSAGAAFAGLRDQLEKHVVQLYQKLLLYQMKSVCLYHRKWFDVFFRDIVLRDDWGGQLDDIRNAEHAVKSDSKQYNSSQVLDRLKALADTAEHQYTELQGITSAIQHQTRRQEEMQQDQKDKECLDDLFDTDPCHDKTRIQSAKGGLLKDSYRWILDHNDFLRWRDDLHSRLLWIKGDPGKGKTMLLCGIIDELKKDPSHRLSYFFCQATEQKLNNATAVLRGLVYCLASQYSVLLSHVRAEYERGGKKQRFEGRQAWQVMSKILESMLQDPILDGAVLIVDALDECEPGQPNWEGRLELLDFIVRMSTSSRAKWIVSSRNWLDIEEKLGTATQKVALSLELNADSVSAAVKSYIGYKVDQLALTKKYDQKLRGQVWDYLASNAHDTFLWVALVCQGLADVRKRNTLAKLKTFPPGLDALYDRMMVLINDSDDADRCRKTLAVASVVYRPVTLKELAVLAEPLEEYADDDQDLEEIVASCGSFLTLREGTVYFVHQSAKDFLLSKASAQIMPSGIAHQHRAIFLRSLEFLSRTLRRDIYSLGAPGSLIDDISTPNPDPLAPVRYSCVHWVDHLQHANPAEKLTLEHLQNGGLVHIFLQRKYLYWLEAMSLQRSVSQAVLAVQNLQALVVAVGAQQLIDLIQDARRFVLSHKGVVEIAPLQLYASALVFSPTQSLVRKDFKHHFPSWITLPPAIGSDWNACLQTLEGHGSPVLSVAFTADGTQLASGSHDKTIKIWDTATGKCVQTLEGHDNGVTSVIFLADGARLASGSHDKTIKVWDTATGNCVQTLEGHNAEVNSIAFTTDGARLASGSDDTTIKVWDVATGNCVQTLEGHDARVNSIAFTTDGAQLASGSHDKTIKVWDAATGNCMQTLEGHGSPVLSVAFTADGTQLASGSHDKTIKIWDTAIGKCEQTLEGHSSSAQSTAFTTDGARLASGSWDNTVKIWDVATGKCMQTLGGHSYWVMSVAFTTDGTRLMSGSWDNTIKVWDAATDKCVQTLEGHGKGVTSVAFTTDGARLASGSWDNTVKVWDATTGKCVQTLEGDGHDSGVTSVAFRADGTQLASGSWDNTVKVWDTATGKCVQTLEGHDGNGVRSVAFSMDSARLASGSSDNTVRVWDAATGKCLQTLEGHGKGVTSVAFRADGTQLASGSNDKTIKVWDAATNKCVQTLEGHDGKVSSVAFTVDGTRLASGSNDKTIKVWDVATGKCVQTLEGHGYWVNSVAFTMDGARLASGSSENTVKVWDIATGMCVQTLEGHDSGVTSVAFMADGARLASGSWDKTIKVWDAATGKCVQTLEGHGKRVTSVAFRADGTRLVSGSHDKTVKIWDVATGKCVQTLEGHGYWVNSVAFTMDGTRLASGSSENTVKVWDAATGMCVQTLGDHDAGVNSIAFTTDGARLVSGSYDKTVKVWDAATGKCVQTLEGHDDMVTSVAFTTDGARLASGSWDKTIKVWDAVTGNCVQMLEGHDSGVTSVAFRADGARLASGSWDNTVKVWDATTGKCVQTIDVSASLSHLAFDLQMNSNLLTKFGTLALDPSISDTEPREASPKLPCYHGCGISHDEVWIVKDTQRLLWLPSEYRPSVMAVAGSGIALGYASGRVIILQLSMVVNLYT